MDEFARAAVVGIGGSTALPATEPAIETLLDARERTRERQFLLRAGARSIYRNAGKELPKATPPATADSEVLRACSEAAAGIMREALLAGDEELVLEFARLLAERSMRVTFDLLPLLLAVRTRNARQAVRPVAGNRGRWLAAFRDEWRWLFAESNSAPLPVRSRWEEGTLDERKALLASVRATQPDVARDWLDAVWKEEGADNRTAFLELLAVNITAADEEFLEKARGDRSTAVRSAAARLLALIPSSAFVQLCVTRANEAVRFESKSSVGFSALVKAVAGKDRRSLKLTCEPPTADDPLARELGAPKGGGTGGARAQLLARLVSLIDPRLWEERAAATPEEIVRAAGESDWYTPLAQGFARAALLHERTNWYLPLLRAAALSDELIHHDWVNDIARSLTNGDAELMLLESLGGRYPMFLSRIDLVLGAMTTPWRAVISGNVLLAIRRIFERGGDGEEGLIWAAALPRIARAIHPASFADALGEWPLGATYYAPSRARQLEQLRRIVELRNRFHEEMKRD